MVLWAACFPLITVGLDLAPHLAFAALRAALAGISLIALGVILRRPVPRGARLWGLIAVVALGATTLGFFGMFHAAEFVSPGLATVVANAQPLVAAMLAYLFLGERLKSIGKIGLILGLGGIVVIAWPGFASGDSRGYTFGIAYVALAATGVAIGNIAIKRLTGRVDAIMAMGFQLLLGAIPLMLLSLSTEHFSSTAWSTKFVTVLVALSVFGTSAAFWLWFTALEHVQLNQANVFTFLVPIFGLAIGAIWFEEKLGWMQGAGAILVLVGISFVQFKERELSEKQGAKRS